MQKKRRVKGEGFFYKRSSDGLWIRGGELEPDENGDRRRVQVSSKNRNEAIEKWTALRRALEEGHVPAKGKKPTVAATFEDWLSSKNKIGPQTKASYRRVAKQRFLNKIGDKPINAVTVNELRGLIQEWENSGYSSQTITNAYNLLNPMFKWAKAEGLRRDNPIERIETPNVTHVEAQPFTSDEAINVLKSASENDDPLYLRWLLQILLARRQGECLGLTEAAINFDKMTVDFSWQLQWLVIKKGYKPSQGEEMYPLSAFELPVGYECTPVWRSACLVRTKTKKNLVLPLIPQLGNALKAFMDHTPRGSGGLIFARPGGEPLSPKKDLEAWKKLLDTSEALKSWRSRLPAIQDPAQPDNRYPGTHTNRHTANTLLQQRGVPEDVRMMILGHSTATANRSYTHQDLEFARTALAKLEDLIPEVRPGR